MSEFFTENKIEIAARRLEEERQRELVRPPELDLETALENRVTVNDDALWGYFYPSDVYQPIVAEIEEKWLSPLSQLKQ